MPANRMEWRSCGMQGCDRHSMRHPDHRARCYVSIPGFCLQRISRIIRRRRSATPNVNKETPDAQQMADPGLRRGAAGGLRDRGEPRHRQARTHGDGRASEIAEGARPTRRCSQEFGAYDDPKVQAYVNDLGQRLAKNSHRPGLEWHFTVLDSPDVNAFALPGGYVYVTRGIMAYMESEADLSGVIGHEIGHVTARHGSQRATRQQAAGLGVLAASILGTVLESGGVRGARPMAASQASQGVAAGLRREVQPRAGAAGRPARRRIHRGQQLRPANMVDVIKLLEEPGTLRRRPGARRRPHTANSRPDWLASHPSNAERLQDISQIASGYEAKATTTTTAARATCR